MAVLNANGLVKMPDDSILDRIRALKGPIEIKTYVSLSCENCPDVVQSLNLMAIHHPDFSHIMVDGQYRQNEIDDLGIQGVPSIIAMNSKDLVHSGKSDLGQLLTKLEKHYGSNNLEQAPKDLGEFDVVVIGAGPAGASAAIYSARKGLKTAVIAEKMGGQVADCLLYTSPSPRDRG